MTAQSDDLAIQRVASHVLASAACGSLPRLAWHVSLSVSERQQLHARWPLTSALWEEDHAQGTSVQTDTREGSELLMPLHAHLMAHRARREPAFTVLANVLACACFGAQHLWQDLGANGRDEVSRLLALAFPALHASNHRNLRWKRHLFLTLGETLGRDDLHPPRCNGCGDREVCFGAPVVRISPEPRRSRSTP